MLKLITRQSKVKPAIEFFLKNYPHYKRHSGYWSEERFTAVFALNPETATPEDVAKAMRAQNVENRCDECQQDFETLIQIGQEPGYDARWLCLCGDCLHKSMEMLADTWRGE